MNVQEPCYADPTLFLMADEDLVESAENAAFRICPMDKAPEPVLAPTQPWEGGDGASPRPVQQDPVVGSVLYDPAEQRFHLWYTAHNNLLSRTSPFAPSLVPDRAPAVCYATSRDGLLWEKPALRLVAYEQSLENNILPSPGPPVKTESMGVVVLNRVPGLPGRLIRSAWSEFDDPVYPTGITFLASEDGFHWTPHFPPVLPLDGDAHCLVWDWHHQCYVCTTRSFVHNREVAWFRRRGLPHLKQKRHIAVARSRDLVHWTPMLPVLEADDRDPENAQLYQMYVLPYGHGYAGFVQLFYMDETMTYGPLDVQLAFSRDLMNWRRVGDRAPILPRGPSGAWDQSHVSLCANPPHPEGLRLRFWYGGKDTEHWQSGNGALGTATLRRDGFACYEAGARWGVVTTAPMEMQWATKPFVSVDAARGEVRVEIVDAETRKPLEGAGREDCVPIQGDDALLPVRYGARRGTWVRHAGRVRFRIHLRQARLYALKAPHCRLGDRPGRERNLWL